MNRPSAQSSLRAFVALVVTLLQVLGALHFALVPHGYSAALGGVVHVHAKTAPRSALGHVSDRRVPSLSTASLSCLSERCPVADAPQSPAPPVELLAAGVVTFGGIRLLGERSVEQSATERVFSRAPKTSPPV